MTFPMVQTAPKYKILAVKCQTFLAGSTSGGRCEAGCGVPHLAPSALVPPFQNPRSATARHIGFPVVVKYGLKAPFCNQCSYSGKVRLIPNGSEIAAQ